MVHHSVATANAARTSETRIMMAAAKAVAFPNQVGPTPTNAADHSPGHHRNYKAIDSYFTATPVQFSRRTATGNGSEIMAFGILLNMPIHGSWGKGGILVVMDRIGPLRAGRRTTGRSCGDERTISADRTASSNN
jgi:hypothetical protein